MMSIEEKRKKVMEIQRAIKVKKAKRYIDKGLHAQNRTPAENASALISKPAEKVDTSNINGFESFAVGFSEGIKDVGRGLSLVDQQSNNQRRLLEQLEEDRPITQLSGRIAGQIAPFLVPSTAIGSLSTAPSRVAASAGLGMAEGGILARGQGGSEEDIFKAAGLGGVIGAGAEVAFPMLGRVARKLYGKVKGTPKNLVDEKGSPLPIFQQALDDAGIGFDEVVNEAQEMSSTLNPKQAARLADFESAGVKATKGDIMQDSIGGFAQQAEEARLFGSTAESLADPYRTFRLEQSNQFITALEKIVPTTGPASNAGDLIKESIKNNLSILKSEKNAFYKQAAQGSEGQVGQIPIITDAMQASIPDKRTIASLSGIEGNNINQVKDILTSYGVRSFDESIDRLKKQGVEPTVLNLENFDEFRKALGRAINSDKSGATAVMAKPIKDALDLEMDSLADNVVKELGGEAPKEVIESLKQARKLVRQIKTEFSPQAIAGKLIESRKDGYTPLIESSKVLNEIVGTNKPVEFLARTIKQLKSGGAKGKDAIDAIKASTIVDLLESSLKGETRKVQGQAIFSPVAFNKRLKQIGPQKLALIFGKDTPQFKKVMQMGRIASAITPPNEAVPKGSAPIILDVMKKLGIVSLSTKIPLLGPLVEGAQGLSESAATRKSVDQAMKSTPEQIKMVRSELEDVAPALASILFVSSLSNNEEEPEN